MHLIYNKIDREWELQDGNDREPMSYFASRDVAVPYSIDLAKRSAALLCLHSETGRVTERMDFR